MDPDYGVISIDIVREVNRIPYAQLILADISAEKGPFAVSNSGFFDHGKPIEIKLRHETRYSAENTVFSGLVVGYSVKAENLKSVLTVELKDAAVKLTQIPRSRVFANQSDSSVIEGLILAQGLQAGPIKEQTPTHATIVQYGCTDWDFIMSRADVNGRLVCVEDGVLSLRTIDTPVFGNNVFFTYGSDEIYAIEIEANAEGQYGEVSSLAWDVMKQEMSSDLKAPKLGPHDGRHAPGNLNSRTLAKALGAGKRTLTSPAPATQQELQAWANASLARSLLGLIRGQISVHGVAGIKLLDIITIKGLGKHFDGSSRITGLRHRVSDGGWVTDIRFGLAADWFSSRPDVAAKPAAGLLPPVGGLQIGVVDKFEEDPEKQFRVKVKIPSLGADQPAIWARLASPDAGKGRGFCFRPEKGDEVVLGFFNEDPRHPVIIGALHSSANTLPERFATLSEKNALKGLVTKKGTIIGFDDQDDGKGSVYIETFNKNKILLDDAKKTISLSDQHGNVITMDEHGITLKSAKDITLEAAGKLEIKSAGDARMDSDGKVEIKGSAVNIK